MPKAPALRASPANRLLAALPAKEYQRLLPELEPVTMAFAQIIYAPGDTIRHIYFPNNSIVSLLAAEEHHASLEVGMIGNEGMTGIAVFMEVRTSRTLALVQGAGTAMRMTSATLRKESTHVSTFHRLLHRYAHSLLTQMSLSSACNRFHGLDARLCQAECLDQIRHRAHGETNRLRHEEIIDLHVVNLTIRVCYLCLGPRFRVVNRAMQDIIHPPRG